MVKTKMTKRILCVLLSLIFVASAFMGLQMTAEGATNPYNYYAKDASGNWANCTWWAWQLAYDNTGVALPGWGNAGTWYNSARNAGYSCGTTPAVNSIAVKSSGTYGHVQFVTAVSGSQIYVKEGGYRGTSNGYHEGWTSTSGVIGYIYLKSSDTTPPAVDDLHVGEFFDSQFTVMAHVTDVNGIKSVRYAVWTEKDGQDDLIWYEGHDTDGNGYFWTHIKYSEHNNEKGKYIIHIYAYDTAGNLTKLGITFNHGSEMKSGYARTIPDGDYVIASAVGNYYLDIYGTELPAAEGRQIDICQKTGAWTNIGIFEIWTLKYNSDGFYSIYQKGTSVSLDVPNATVCSKTKLQTHNANGSTAQKFAISKIDSGNYRIQAKCSGLSLDVYERQAVTGTPVIQDEWHGGTNQQWYFIPYKPSVSSSDKVASTVYNGHEYTLYKKLMTWNDARDWCKNQGGNLVTITSSGEQSAVESLMTKASNWIWLGATDEASEGTWKWVTGESFTYSKWGGGQPDNTGNEDYMHLYLDGKWNDIPDYDGRCEYFILEKTHTHTSNSGTITTQPTCTQTGVKTYKCTTCGATVKTETVSALGHTEPDGNGNCTRCGAHIKDIVNPDACPYCGQVHDGIFGRIVAFFHKVIYLIDQLF
ncbi:MAG: GBS Bsp-like repeat-containing protein [Clostridia bacterium]|nr:GBS Bsp-like repeat-containing protein [Clostridia bacterium]